MASWDPSALAVSSVSALAVSSVSSVVRREAAARADGAWAGSVVLQLQASIQAAREDHAEDLGHRASVSAAQRPPRGVPCTHRGLSRPTPKPAHRRCQRPLPR